MTTKPKSARTSKVASAGTAATTSAKAWKQHNEPLELPSGNYMKIRKLGFQAFMKAGLIPNSLMATVQSAIDRGVEPDLDIKVMTQDKQQMQELLDMIDDVIIFVAIEPEVEAVPTKKVGGKNVPDDAAKNEETLYVDEIDDEDKMFLFGLCTGGTRDVETFRREQAGSLAAIQRG